MLLRPSNGLEANSTEGCNFPAGEANKKKWPQMKMRPPYTIQMSQDCQYPKIERDRPLAAPGKAIKALP